MKRAFTLIELLVVISIIALLIAILLPALGAARRTARQMQNNTQLRGIHQALFTYSQENKTYYVGLIPSTGGQDIYTSVDFMAKYPQLGTTTINSATSRGRVGVLAVYDYFTPEYAISPSETSADATPWREGTDFTNQNNSYAMLSIGGNNTNQNAPYRRQEWSDTASSQVVAVSDRNTTSPTSTSAPESVHTEIGSGEWKGGIAWNDGHTGFEQTHIMETTKVADQTNKDDNIWTGTGMPAGFDSQKNIAMKTGENP
jgi:prepilin-type N-terminal cleavage/methylation domain-containing protein